MEKVRKLLGSPSTNRKANNVTNNNNALNGAVARNGVGSHGPGARLSATGLRPYGGGYFGVALDELAYREDRDVPYLVTRVCAYIYDNGLNQEGIFRVNGNARIVEQLRLGFDGAGDADLETTEDVYAVAGLLKLFLRELPKALIPEGLTAQFVQVQQELGGRPGECVHQLKALLHLLPRTHYNALKYLIQFLVLIARQEKHNKMGPMALGIVFGPNIFRCTAGIQGLREQGVTNHIIQQFIKEYDTLFLADSEVSPYTKDFIPDLKKGRIPPPRPPPPRLASNSSPPVPSPRKQKGKYDQRVYQDDDADPSPRDGSTDTSHSLLTPRLSDNEFLDTPRAGSPGPLDSDCSEVTPTVCTPRHAGANEVVEKAITSAISEHLFGDHTNSVSSEDSLSNGFHVNMKEGLPMPAPRRTTQDRTGVVDNAEESSVPDERLEENGKVSVKQRIQKFEIDDETADLRGTPTISVAVTTKPAKQRPKSEAFELFESQGIVISPAPVSLAKRLAGGDDDSDNNDDDGDEDEEGIHVNVAGKRPVPQPRSPRKRHASPENWPEVGRDTNSQAGQDSDDSGFGTIQRPQNTLNTFKRAPGPKNRRNPSRSAAKKSEDDTVVARENNLNKIGEETSLQSNEVMEDYNHNATTKSSINHNATTKPSISFLKLHPTPEPTQAWVQGDRKSSEGSGEEKVQSRKPYIPPLDLSILHEHGDGSEPIPAEQGQSISLQKARSMKDEGGAVLSPRTAKLKRKNSDPVNTDVPPSPPTEQTIFTKSGKRNEDDHVTQIKQLTKKIQSCKRKIKVFEEAFEQDHGYRPSQTDKAAKPEIKRCVQELARARKDLRTIALPLSPQDVTTGAIEQLQFRFDEDLPSQEIGVKEEAERQALGLRSGCVGGESNLDTPSSLADTPTTNHSGDDGGSRDPAAPWSLGLSQTASQTETLQALQDKLKEKRREGSRPEDLSMMNRDQIQEEKISVQKALLHFESVHGRPSTKAEKELMRPLYDRYRTIKRLLTKPLSPRDKTIELEAVPEDGMVDFNNSPSSNREPIKVPVVDTEEEQDFNVTRDLRLLQNTIRPNAGLGQGQSSKVTGGEESGFRGRCLFEEEGAGLDQENIDVSPERGAAWNLHELSLAQLLEQQTSARNDKKRLRRVLREFEDDFFQQTGRKVQKEDRAPMEKEYHEYKQIKAKLKLLDALLSKHDPIGIAIP